MVGVFSDLVGLLGLPKSLGEIYGFIFASAEPPTFAEIEHKLGLSKGSVSQGLRALRELGAIREAGVANGGPEAGGPVAGEPKRPGASGIPASDTPAASGPPALRSSGLPASAAPAARATHWEATTELRQLIGTLLRERLTPYLERQDNRMQSAELALEAEAPHLSGQNYKALKRRLEKLQTWQSRARTVLPVIGKML